MAKKPVIEKNNTPTINPIGTEKYIPAKKVKFDCKSNNSASPPITFYAKFEQNNPINLTGLN